MWDPMSGVILLSVKEMASSTGTKSASKFSISMRRITFADSKYLCVQNNTFKAAFLSI